MSYPCIYRLMQLSKIKTNKSSLERTGGGERVRTDDLLLARQALSQLSYTPDKSGGPGRTRTSDLTIISRVL